MTLGLSVGQVLAIHSAVRSEFGGRAGLRDRGALEASVARPFATFDGEDLYPDVASKAAALLHFLVTNHPFVDGNKRTGALSAELLLEVNDVVLVASDAEFEEIVMAVASGTLDIEQLVIWFRQRTRFRA